MTPQPATPPTADRPHRLSLSQIIELLLQRGGSDRSSVSLTRNAKGATQIDVTVRTGNQEDADTVEAAAHRAVEVYDSLRLRYPMVEDDAPIVVAPDSEQAATMRARAEQVLAGMTVDQPEVLRLAHDVLALLHTQRVQATAAGEAAEVTP